MASPELHLFSTYVLFTQAVNMALQLLGIPFIPPQDPITSHISQIQKIKHVKFTQLDLCHVSCELGDLNLRQGSHIKPKLKIQSLPSLSKNPPKLRKWKATLPSVT